MYAQRHARTDARLHAPMLPCSHTRSHSHSQACASAQCNIMQRSALTHVSTYTCAQHTITHRVRASTNANRKAFPHEARSVRSRALAPSCIPPPRAMCTCVDVWVCGCVGACVCMVAGRRAGRWLREEGRACAHACGRGAREDGCVCVRYAIDACMHRTHICIHARAKRAGWSCER